MSNQVTALENYADLDDTTLAVTYFDVSDQVATHPMQLRNYTDLDKTTLTDTYHDADI